MQVAGDPKDVQINLMRHAQKYHCENTRRENLFKPKQPSGKNIVQENPKYQATTKKSFDPRNGHKNKDRCSKCGDSTHVEGFQCPPKKFQCKACHKIWTFTSLSYQKKNKHPSSCEDQRPINYMQEWCMCRKKPCVDVLKITVPVMIPSTCRSRCSTHKPV